MDALLSYLESSGQGLSVCGLDVGSSAHADDVRAASISIEAARTQGNLVNHFCNANSLKLNITKTELVQFANKKPDPIFTRNCRARSSSATESQMFGDLVAVSISPQPLQLKNAYTKPSMPSLP